MVIRVRIRFVARHIFTSAYKEFVLAFRCTKMNKVKEKKIEIKASTAKVKKDKCNVDNVALIMFFHTVCAGMLTRECEKPHSMKYKQYVQCNR